MVTLTFSKEKGKHPKSCLPTKKKKKKIHGLGSLLCLWKKLMVDCRSDHFISISFMVEDSKRLLLKQSQCSDTSLRTSYPLKKKKI